MTVLVVGAGAVGSLFGARFAAAGHRVLLVGRPAHVEAIRARGVEVTGRDAGTFRCEAATEIPRGTHADLALLTVKAFDVAAAADAVARALAPTPLLIPQNGLGSETVAHRSLEQGGWPAGSIRLVRAVHSVPATLTAPGVVRAAGTGEVVLPAADPAAGDADPAARFATLFRSSGFSVRAVPSIEREVWKKVVVNAAINPVTAVHRVPNGRLAQEPWRTEALSLLLEARSVAEAAGVVLSEAEVRGDLDRVVRETAENRSSMLQDLERGHRTEIEAISGEIVRRAAAHGIEVPATRAVLAKVRAAQPS
ncbi:MAG TPA: 2-dehydropantoate 2-reductase [Thermoplasmata archaeon]|nr:2-dehydropantoate 2-reductase [Thermoplasmata archaeon]